MMKIDENKPQHTKQTHKREGTHNLRHDDGQMKHNGVEVIGPFGQCKLNDELNDETWY